jgi:hypothetical protein
VPCKIAIPVCRQHSLCVLQRITGPAVVVGVITSEKFLGATKKRHLFLFIFSLFFVD